jgi:hypothetical protein
MLFVLTTLFVLSATPLPAHTDPYAFDFQGAWLGMPLDEFKGGFANVVCYPATGAEGAIGAFFCSRRGDLPDPRNSSPGVYRFYEDVLYSIESKTWNESGEIGDAFDALSVKFGSPRKQKTGVYARWERRDQTVELKSDCDPRPDYFCVVFTQLSVDARVRDALGQAPRRLPRY